MNEIDMKERDSERQKKGTQDSGTGGERDVLQYSRLAINTYQYDMQQL